jgi:hypothetical protein
MLSKSDAQWKSYQVKSRTRAFANRTDAVVRSGMFRAHTPRENGAMPFRVSRPKGF